MDVEMSATPKTSPYQDEVYQLQFLEESQLKRPASDLSTESAQRRRKKQRSSLATKRRSIADLPTGQTDGGENYL